MNKKQEKTFWKKYGGWLALSVIMVLGLFLQTTMVQDYWRGMSYTAEENVREVEEALELTSLGKRIFRATRPELSEREEFNTHCENQSEDVSLLGCYTGGNIYVFEITEESLRPANKVTMAHELLHAAWERMGKREQNEVREELLKLYDEKKDWFDEELGVYDENERIEEIYTRAATKLQDLPEKLEKHYAKYFQNRKKIVDYYEEYEALFLALQAEMEKLAAEIEKEQAAIEQAREGYLKAVESLDGKIDSFNVCADTAGCFTSQAEFNQRRGVLMAEKEQLEAERVSLNERIEQNNDKIEEYREKQMMLGELNDAMDSRIELLSETE